MTPESPSHPPCDVVLRDGSTARLRPLVPEDRDALTAFYSRVSDDSIHLRYFGRGPAPGALERLLTPNHDDEFALVAECAGGIVAIAQYARDLRTRSRAEAAFLVADAMQGRGLGTRLLEQLAAHARSEGIDWFHAWVLGANHKMLQVFVDSGFRVQSTTDQGVIEVVLSLETTPEVTAQRARRASLAARASIGAFFEPSTVAVVGASRGGAGVGAQVLHNLRTTGFGGRIVPIHPSATTVQDLPAYPRLTAVPGDVDLAVIVVPSGEVLAVARDAAEKRVKALVVISAGFSETGVDGRARELELLTLVREAGMRMIGPNCMGILNADPSVLLNATFSPVFPPAGRVAFSTQSGALGLAILEYARRVNLGMSTFASIGNKADVSSNDLIQYWAADPKTAVILLYLESFGNPRKFRDLASEVGRHKPIVAVKAGRSTAGARAASSHTGALAASDTIVDALFHHAGVIRTTTLEEMFDVALLLDRQPLPAGPRVAILTNAGGPGILAADACEGHGLSVTPLGRDTLDRLRAFLPAAAGCHNPVDMLATASAADYGRAMQLLLADPHVDSLITIFIPPLVTAAADVAAAITAAARSATKPVLATFMSVDGAIPMLAPIPCYRFPESAVTALARATRYAAWQRAPQEEPPRFDTEVASARERLHAALERGDGWLTPEEAQQVLEAMGIATAPARLVHDLEGAVRTAAELGYPVALKGVGPGILHKSDVGAVRLGIASEAALAEAYHQMHDRLGGQLAGVFVQRMAPSGVEMFIGGLQDPSFGPVVVCGSGGVFVELFNDAVCRLCPLTHREAEALLREVRGAARLHGFRGAAAADSASLAEALVRVSALLHACPELLEMDVNPLSVQTHGSLALDVRMRVGRAPAPAPTRRVRY